MGLTGSLLVSIGYLSMNLSSREPGPRSGDAIFSCIVESGIRLQEALDYLVWSYNCKMGNITAKMAYQFNLDNHLPVVELWWHKNIWSWNLPIKLKCLCWLNIYNDQYLG